MSNVRVSESTKTQWIGLGFRRLRDSDMAENLENLTYSELRRLKQAVSVELNRRKMKCVEKLSRELAGIK